MKKFLIIGILVLLGLVGYFSFSNTPSEESAMTATSGESMVKDVVSAGDEMEADGKMMAGESGSYVDYDEKKFAADKNKRRIYFFHATWCPSCKVADKNLTSRVEDIPSDVVIYKTNYDKETALKKKYGVTYQHTFVQVDADGNEVMKWNGGDVNQLLTKII